jgi:PAS domain S-box-containing protein
MRLSGLKWLTAGLVIAFLFGFDYLRHFVFMDLLHRWPLYVASVLAVGLLILLFNHLIFQALASMQRVLRQQNQRLAALNAVGVTLSHSLDLDELLSDALAQILATTPDAGAAAVYLADPERLLVRASPQLPAPAGDAVLDVLQRVTLAQCVAGPCAGTSKAPCEAALTPHGLHVWAGAPLRAKGAAVGCLLLISAETQAASEDDRRLVEAIGAQLGIAIENATLHGQIAQQAGHLTALIESSANAIITLDRQGIVRSWNHGAEQIYGWSYDEALGQTIPMVPPELRGEARAIMDRMLESGESLTNFETRRLRKGGEQIPVLVTTSPVRGADGAITGLLGISTDLRERKRLERDLLRQQRDLAVLAERERLARALHDDVGQVLGYVNMQGQAIGELLAAGKTELAGRQLERMVTMVQEAHDEVRQQILDLKVGMDDGKPLAAALEALVRRYQRHHDFAVELLMDGLDGVCLAPGAQTQLLHIVQEALVNARKHARAQRVWVVCAHAESRLIVTVTDNGRGFEQGSASAQRGDHFGLRIMQERAAEIGGELAIASHDGGTSVTVSVPVCNVEERVYESASR